MAISAFINPSIVRQLSFLFIILFLSGCSSLQTVVYRPIPDALNAIEAEEMDCKYASITGQLAFQKAGERSCVTCGFLVYDDKPGHCWNEVWCPEDGNWHLIDLSRAGNDGWPLDEYPEYIATSRWYTPPSVWNLIFDDGADWKAENLNEIVAALPEKRMISAGARVVPGVR